MSRCFGDSFFFLAYLNRRDDAHEQAVRYLTDHDPVIHTTAWVLTEVADAIARSRRDRFGELLASIRSDPRMDIVPASAALFDAGVDMYLARPDKHWSLTDCISFVVMQDRGLTDALTGDHHFEQAGFRALLK
jgi:predicted nucleic acid-binding protein